jgi:hypothetical protein
MKAFHPDARSAYTAGGSWSRMRGWYQRIAFFCVLAVGSGQQISVDFSFGLVYSTCRFKSTNYKCFGGTDKPVSGWHRGAVV